MTDNELGSIHTPVMLDRCVELLSPALEGRGTVFLDATTGMGGHTSAILGRFPHASALCVDRDREALDIARRRLGGSANRVRFEHVTYDRIAEVTHGPVNAVLFDLGVSSLQLDRPDRGFAYRIDDAPLDMRMDRGDTLTAADVVNSYSMERLWTLFRQYGEEKHARRIAQHIVVVREQRPFRTTGDLTRAVAEAVHITGHRGHPAKRVFQAIRIEVNHELTVLRAALPAALKMLAPGGRIVVLSFQSLEDRIVKQVFREVTVSTAPPDMPVLRPQDQPSFRLLTRGAEQASAEERERNPRAASVRLRAVERIAVSPVDDPARRREESSMKQERSAS